jgi:hypothetical protein
MLIIIIIIHLLSAAKCWCCTWQRRVKSGRAIGMDFIIGSGPQTSKLGGKKTLGPAAAFAAVTNRFRQTTTKSFPSPPFSPLFPPTNNLINTFWCYTNIELCYRIVAVAGIVDLYTYNPPN